MVKLVVFMKKEPYCLTTAGKEFLRSVWNNPDKSVLAICAQMGIGSVDTIYKFAKALDLGPKIIPGTWSGFEDSVIIRGWRDPTVSYKQIAEELPRRTIIAVRARATRLNLGKKAKYFKTKTKEKQKAEIWPADMPHFEDDPRAVNKPKYDDHHKIGFDF